MEGRSLRRNAPTLYNVVFKKLLFHDGRETDLAAQVWGPLLSPDEMGNPAIGPLLDRLRADAVYGPAFSAAFPGEGVSMTTLGRAIAAFEATLLKGDSRFDRAMFGGEKSALTPIEWRGYDIFVHKGGCVSCHAIGDDSALFTDQSWHDTGVAFATRTSATTRVELAPGVFRIVRLSDVGLSEATMKSDLGRFEITGKPEDRWAYTTPTLRGLKETWPYMHDGSFKSLEEVVDFYDRGGGANPALDPKIKPLGLSDDEKKALVAFLAAL
jgi:cytochrome c peroxidase